VAQGFLEVKQGNRTFVKSITSEKLQDPFSLLIKADTQKIFDLIEVRKAMEAWGAFHAAQRVTEEDIERLEEIIGEMKRALDEGRSWEKQDADFHLAMAQATHNTIQTHMMFTIYDLLRESVARVFRDRKKTKTLFQQHYQIFNAIKNRSPDEAREKVLEHLNYVESEVKAFRD
jgi:GntR family transcriptional repressor for pyruvate dehydrogenase complex